MITKNFKAILASVLQCLGSVSGYKAVVPVKKTNGDSGYTSPYFTGYPSTVDTGVRFSASSQGIHVGTGDTAPTEDDYNLESTVTSGLSSSSPSATRDADNDGNPFVEFLFTLTNTTGSDIVIKEIGYFQKIIFNTTYKSTSSSDTVVMLDRTVLSTPVTVPANDSAAVKYRLTTVLPS